MPTPDEIALDCSPHLNTQPSCPSENNRPDDRRGRRSRAVQQLRHNRSDDLCLLTPPPDTSDQPDRHVREDHDKRLESRHQVTILAEEELPITPVSDMDSKDNESEQTPISQPKNDIQPDDAAVPETTSNYTILSTTRVGL